MRQMPPTPNVGEIVHVDSRIPNFRFRLAGQCFGVVTKSNHRIDNPQGTICGDIGNYWGRVFVRQRPPRPIEQVHATLASASSIALP
jgi:hypothetical protein